MYDRFGGFDGFILLGEDGSELRFHSRSLRMAELIRRVWKDKILGIVFGEHGDSIELAQIILKQ